MLTREQKKNTIEESKRAIKDSNCLLLIDFSSASVSEMRGLRVLLRDFDAKLQVVKKRLLKIALKDSGVALDPTEFPAQAGAVFSKTDCISISGKLYKFLKDLAKTKKSIGVLAGWDLKENRLITAEEFETLAKLPSREQLLAQIAMMLTMPLKKLMIALDSRKEQLSKQ